MKRGRINLSKKLPDFSINIIRIRSTWCNMRAELSMSLSLVNLKLEVLVMVSSGTTRAYVCSVKPSIQSVKEKGLLLAYLGRGGLGCVCLLWMIHSEPLIHKTHSRCHVLNHVYVVIHTSFCMWCSSIQLRHTRSCPIWWLCLHAGQKIPLWSGWCNFLLWGTRFVSLLCPYCQTSCGNGKQMVMTIWNIKIFPKSIQRESETKYENISN